jgi:hypothetical protein
VSLSNDGLRIAIGADGNDGTANRAGHARVFDFGKKNKLRVLFFRRDEHSLTITGVEVAIEQQSSQADPASTSPIVFDVFFAEDVSGFATGDVTVTSTSGEPLIGVVDSVSANAYTVTVDVTLSGVVSASIARAVANDADNIPNFASTSIDNQVVFDKIGVLIDDIVAIEAKLDDKTQCRDGFREVKMCLIILTTCCLYSYGR